MKVPVENVAKPHFQEGYGPQSPPNAPIESKIWKTLFFIASYQPIEFQKNRLSGFHFLKILEFA